MAVTCEIDFDNNPHGTYFGGQVLTGRVTLKLDKMKSVKAITLNITGYAETRWIERVTTNRRRRRRTFHGREDYIASKTFLVGSNLSSQVSIEAGIHTYNFVCQIPAECPSSFEGTNGRVRYMTKVTLVRPNKFDQNYTRCFTVLKVMDLNFDSPLLRVPAHSETSKTYCCWPCRSDPLALQLTVPQTGFVPGQSIPLSVLITNDSHVPVEQLLMTFVMLVTYHSRPPSMPNSTSERLVVNSLKGDSVQRNCKKLFTYDIRVPATPPTCFNLCGIIQIAYQVEVEARVKGCHNNEVVSIPVTIGSVPLTQQVLIQPRGQIIQPLDVNGLTGASVASAPPQNASRPWAVDDSIPPPNYQEAIHMRSTAATKPDNSDEPEPVQPNTLSLDGSAYQPLYPVFDIPSPSAPPPADYTQNYMAERAFVNPGLDVDKDKGTWL
ncbi:arrestin domain-containing protein 17 isoform X1 [Drosophila rhopaloa]|uniref:Arrestin domain-containing protein 2 isoform X1 n=1 Tax=Drosophila rhopaloa TaxID=1041015 RepID=A0A6P4DYS1_DRORH|nr:arrestin domain-containing protein 17 isoform X1 [Drosophila rhopaloa]